MARYNLPLNDVYDVVDSFNTGGLENACLCENCNKPLLNGSVKVSQSDLTFRGSVLNRNGKLMEVVTLNYFGFNYVVVEKSGMLYTQNENGYPNKETVFTLVKN